MALIRICLLLLCACSAQAFDRVVFSPTITPTATPVGWSPTKTPTPFYKLVVATKNSHGFIPAINCLEKLTAEYSLSEDGTEMAIKVISTDTNGKNCLKDETSLTAEEYAEFKAQFNTMAQTGALKKLSGLKDPK